MCESAYKHFKGRDLVYCRPTDVLDVCPAGFQNQMCWGTHVPILKVGVPNVGSQAGSGDYRKPVSQPFLPASLYSAPPEDIAP